MNLQSKILDIIDHVKSNESTQGTCAEWKDFLKKNVAKREINETQQRLTSS